MNLTVLERLFSETPAFFKKVQVLTFAALATLNGLAAFVPAHYLTLANTAGVTIIIVCAFAVKDSGALSGGITVAGIVDLITQLSGQVSEVKNAVAGQVTTDQAKAIADNSTSAKPTV